MGSWVRNRQGVVSRLQEVKPPIEAVHLLAKAHRAHMDLVVIGTALAVEIGAVVLVRQRVNVVEVIATFRLVAALVSGLMTRLCENMVAPVMMIIKPRVHIVLRMPDRHLSELSNQQGRKPQLVFRVVLQSSLVRDRLGRKPLLVKRVRLGKERQCGRPCLSLSTALPVKGRMFVRVVRRRHHVARRRHRRLLSRRRFPVLHPCLCDMYRRVNLLVLFPHYWVGWKLMHLG